LLRALKYFLAPILAVEGAVRDGLGGVGGGEGVFALKVGEGADGFQDAGIALAEHRIAFSGWFDERAWPIQPQT